MHLLTAFTHPNASDCHTTSPVLRSLAVTKPSVLPETACTFVIVRHVTKDPWGDDQVVSPVESSMRVTAELP